MLGWDPQYIFKPILYFTFSSSLTETVLNKGIERTNLLFGALDLDVTKVVSTHGTIDPWYRLGILEDINEDSPTIVIPGWFEATKTVFIFDSNCGFRCITSSRFGICRSGDRQ